MKILITHEIFPPEKTGGGEDVMSKLASDMIAAGNEVEVFTSGDPSLISFGNVKTRRFKINRYLMNLFEKKIEKAAKDFDIIQTSSGNLCYPSWVAAKKLRKPIVCIVHHAFGKYWKDVRGPVIGRAFEAAEKFFLSRDYDCIVVQNRSTEKLVKSINRKSKIIFLPSGIENFTDIKAGRKEKMVLFVGSYNITKQIAKVKGLDYFLEAAKKLPNIKFLIVGGGDYIETLKKSSLPNVKFLGRVVGKPLRELYSKALVFCLPSLAEGFSRATAEAMAAGCAIVSTIDLGQDGKIIEPKNPEQIAERIKFYIENPKVAALERKKNSSVARRLTWKNFISGMRDIYINAVKAKTNNA